VPDLFVFLHSMTFAGDFFDVNTTVKNTVENNVSVADGLAKYSITLNVAPRFGFIPTPSALDIGHGSTSLVESDYSTVYSELTPPASPKNTPFANFITANSGLGPSKANNNEGHLTFETRNGNWLASELQGQHPTSGCIVMCSYNSITGNPSVCTSPSTYSVPASTGMTYTWSATPNMSIVPNGATASISAANNGFGMGTITVILTSGACADTLQKQVVVGGPLDDFTVSQQDNTAQFCANSFGNWMMVNPSPIGDVTYFQWGYVNVNTTDPPVIVNPSGSYTQDFTFPAGGTYQIYAREGNACGLGETNIATVNVSDVCGGGGFGSFVAYPNPAGNTMTISTAAATTAATSTTPSSISATTTGATPPGNNARRAFTYKLYDKLGRMLKQGGVSADKDAVMDTSDLPSDNYFLHVFIGKQEIQKQIMVRH